MAGDRATRWTERHRDPLVRTQVRTAVPVDAEAVSTLEARCLGADAWSAALVAEGVRGALPTVTYLVAERDGVVTGHAVVSAAGEIAELQRIAVDEQHRRTGVGTALMAAAVEVADTTEADRLLLEVRTDNAEALAFYADHGFAEIDRRARYYADGATAVVLRRGLGRGAVPARSPAGHNDAVTSTFAAAAPVSTQGPLVLGIETSCDETGCRDRVRAHPARRCSRVLGGGARALRRRRTRGRVAGPTSRRWCPRSSGPARRRGSRSSDLDALAVTAGPGLAGALLVGVAAAKSLALALDKPLYGVNHLSAHVAVDQLEHGALPEPCLALLVSGGHSSLLRVLDVTSSVEPLGSTIDDAAGEAFDKVARLLGLPFPGGPHIDRAATSGSSVAIDFPRGLSSRRDLERHRFDFSFSGLKTAVARWVQAREASGEPVPVADVAASFQEAVCDVLTRKAIDAAIAEGIEDLLIGGGVAANSRLRALAEERAAARGIRVRVPRPGLCTDNGAMVAALGAEMVARGRTPSALDLPADSSMPVTQVLA